MCTQHHINSCFCWDGIRQLSAIVCDMIISTIIIVNQPANNQVHHYQHHHPDNYCLHRCALSFVYCIRTCVRSPHSLPHFALSPTSAICVYVCLFALDWHWMIMHSNFYDVNVDDDAFTVWRRTFAVSDVSRICTPDRSSTDKCVRVQALMRCDSGMSMRLCNIACAFSELCGSSARISHPSFEG